MTDRLVVDFREDGQVGVSVQRDGDLVPDPVGDPMPLASPLDAAALADLRWYLEDYLAAPFGVYGDRGAKVENLLREWGEGLFGAVFGSGAARDAYVRTRSRGNPVEVVFRSAAAGPLGLPWELMRDPARPDPLALEQVAVTRMLTSAQLGEPFTVAGSRLRVLMVICRPQGPDDVGYQMIARRLLPLLEAVRGSVELVVLRPPTLARLEEVLGEAVRAGELFQVVHFDGHGVFGTAAAVSGGWGQPHMFAGSAQTGMLAFEKSGGGSDLVPAEKVARVLAGGQVPVVVVNACQSGQLGAQVEAAVATRLLQGGASSVVAMAYSVYAVAAAEFMAVFYERLFAGDAVTDAVTVARHHLAAANLRPSPRGRMPLADWMVPVHYTRREVRFPGLRTQHPNTESLQVMLERFRATGSDGTDAGKPGGELEPVGWFVGRDGLLYTLDTAARLQKVVVLHGPGGTGKTELAKAFGRWWRDTQGVEEPEWVIWHSFEPGVATFGLDGVVTGIGLHIFGPGFVLLDAGQRQQAVAELLQTRRLLLLWDNFESVHTMPDPAGATPALDQTQRQQLRDFLDRVRECGASAVVITSRSREDWLGDVRRIEIGGLNPEEAVQYADRLLEPYPRAQPRRQQRAFADLITWLDGHPLSMRLILPLLDGADPQALLDGLHGTASLPARDDGGRTTSLAACISYSITHLPPDDRAALSAVALFHGVADADVLAIFSRRPEVPEQFRSFGKQDWERVLNQATTVGLLTALGSGMYRIHPALPAYLADRWRTDTAADYIRQHADATRALLDAYAALGQWLNQQIEGGDAQLAITVIGVQRSTMGALLGYAMDHRLWEQAQDIAQPLDEYWDVRGLSEEARVWVDRARLALEDANGAPPELATTAGGLWLFLVGSEAARQIRARRLDEADRTYTSILDALQELPVTDDRQRFISVAYHQLGTVAQERGRWDEAENWYRKSLTIKEELGNRPGTANTYHNLGTVAQERGRWDEAENWYRKSLTISEELGNRPGTASTYHQLGTVAQERGRWDEAEDWYRKSLTISEELGDR
ncbi:MAG: tetratricopeptide repeat protein, partial [Streptomyces sp.]|nr:tetratricopeptide repeat protein [Streptomyces sp.]